MNMSVSTESEYQCRLCLATTQTVVNIYEGDFIRMLEMLTSIKVQENDGLPRYSCSKCAEDLETALSVKERFIKSHETLLDILENDKQLLQNLAMDSELNNSVIIVNCDELSNEEISQMISNIPEISQTPAQIVLDELHIKEEENEEDTEYEYLDEEFEVNSNCQNSSETEWSDSYIKKPLKKKKCNICDRYIRMSNFNRHVSGHNHDSKTKCPICKRLITVTNIEKHIMLHNSGPATCEICGAVYKNMESLRGHVFYQHKNSAGQYVCEECGKSFRIKYKFVMHKKRAHTNLRNFKCETCKKGFFTKPNLMSHVRMTHEKQRPYLCEFCQSAFSSSYALKTHRRRHTNEKPYVCEQCPEGFRQKVSLRSHLKSKHGIEEAKEFFCEKCQKGFATDYALNVHKRLHLSEKCLVCSETFGADYLEIHLREEHNIVKEDGDDSES